jgi:uncharacterized protein YyaL (SSP411 family)
MDETSYSDPRVIAAINQHFVPIRVDNDRYPDVNRRYNMGGWPTTAFLAASGDVITGATYLPPDQMLESLARVKAFFDANQTAIKALESERTHAADAEAARAHMGGLPITGEEARSAFQGDPEVPFDIPGEVALRIVRSFDPMHGGIGTEPKFPQPDVYGFLLAYALLRGGSDDAPTADGSSALPRPSRVREVVRATLSQMASGGVYDHVAGGFFRYATQRDWSVPHFEKMLEDNARLASLYANASLMADDHDFGDPELYRRTSEGIVDYLLATLMRPDVPAFSGSQDADEHYYALGAAERADLAEPFVDPTVYVDWNALTARALLCAAPVLDRPDLIARATDLLSYVLESALDHGALAHFLRADGRPGEGAPLLADQVGVAAALLDAYEVTAERRWLERAQKLADWVGDELRAPDGRLNDRLARPGESAGLLAQPVPALDENALAAEVLLRLEAYTGETRFRDRAREILVSWAGHYEKHGVAAAPYAQALLRYLERPDHIVVVGGRDDPEARRLHAAALTTPHPLRTLQWLDPDEPADAERIGEAGFLEAVTAEDGAAARAGQGSAAAAYVCRGRTCSLFRS